jgi:tetratricopeptide (TPR) repeat protein
MNFTRPILGAVFAAAVSFGMAHLTATPAFAKGEPVDCSKKANRAKPECKKNREDLRDNELYYAGYWLARAGKYEQALTYLRAAKNPDDPRFLTYIGFATRKLGDADKAMGYYHRALSLDADYVIARAYLGEAFLDRGELSKAVEQLGEIEKRCGTTCVEYQELSAQIEMYRAKG